MSHQQALSGLLHDMSQLNGSGCVGGMTEPESFSMSIMCPKSMVGRVIGKGGETIKALQQYTGAMIQIDQSQDPTRVTIVGKRTSMDTAASMVKDIVEGNFKGFAMLRQMTLCQTEKTMPGWDTALKPQPVYIQGYGFVPPSQYVDEDTKAALAQSMGDPGFAQNHLGQADPLSPMFQHGVSAAQFNALAGNGALLNANMLKNASLAFSPSVGVKVANGLSPLPAGADVKSPATRRLFNGIPIAANGCSTMTPMPMQQQQERSQSPGSTAAAVAAAAAVSAAQPSAMYRSAPTSPHSINTGAVEGQQLGASAFDFRSAPTSPNSTAFSFNTNGSLQGYQRSKGVGAITNSISSLDLGGISEESAQPNGDMYGQLRPQDQYLAASTGINGMTAEKSAALHARLGLDSSLGMFAMGGNASRGHQPLDSGPRSVSLSALGQRQALFGNGVPSFGAGHAAKGIPSQAAAAQQQSMNDAMTQAMLGQLVANNQATAPERRGTPIAPAAAEEAAAHLQAAAQELAKSSPASSYSSTSSLFASGGASPKLPPNWMQLKDPEGRHFFIDMKTGETQWTFPTA